MENKLLFTNPSKRILMADGYPETYSKGIDPKSMLHLFIHSLRNRINETFPQYQIEKPRPPHVEITCTKISDSEMANQASTLHGLKIPIENFEQWNFMGKDNRAFVLNLISIPNYGMTHCTVVCFRDGKAKPSLEDLRHEVQNLITFFKKSVKQT